MSDKDRKALLDLLREARKEIAGWYDECRGGDPQDLEIVRKINDVLGDEIAPLSDQ